MDTPREGMGVHRLTRKGKIITGEVVGLRDDGTYSFFIVSWNADDTTLDRTEYPMRAWGDVVFVPTCPECDSPYHTDGDCRNHFA